MSGWRHRLSEDRRALWAGALLAVVVLFALTAGGLERLLGVAHATPDLALRYCPASWAHPLGCDPIGQDVLLRLAYGARVSLLVGVCAAALQLVIGVAVGAWAGWRGGRTDALLMRGVDALLSLPLLPLLLVAAALRIGSSEGSGVARIIVILAAFGWMPMARVARAEVMKTRALDYVIAAQAVGASTARTLWHHVLPNASATVLVLATLDVGRNILLEAALSYLGLGIRPPQPSWGNMLSHAESELLSRPALAFWPGACIVLTVLCVSVVGEGVRRALDPRDREGVL